MIEGGDHMIEIEKYVGKTVTIECSDGAIFENYYVDCFTDAYDNYEPNEDSIDILKHKGESDGTVLYRSEIKSIIIVD